MSSLIALLTCEKVFRPVGGGTGVQGGLFLPVLMDIFSRGENINISATNTTAEGEKGEKEKDVLKFHG